MMWLNFKNEEAGDLAAKLKAAGFDVLAEKLTDELKYQEDSTRKKLLEAAKQQYEIGSNDDVEIDPDAATSEGDDGTFVMMWGWVNHAEALDNPNPGDDDEKEEQMYRNYYRHDDCSVQPGIAWDDTHTAMCNDRCPSCGDEIEPYKSDEL